MMPLKIVLAMSDQQLVTDVSVIINAYSHLRYGLSFYHWQMTTSLAWYSSATQLGTLLFLKQHLQRNRCLWYVRVFLMTGLAVMVAVAIVPTGISPASVVIPARCVFYFVYTHGVKSYQSLINRGLP